MLEDDLGPGVAAALARTADQLRDDADHLDASPTRRAPSRPWAATAPWTVGRRSLALPRAVRTRVWRLLAVAAGAPAGQLSRRT